MYIVPFKSESGDSYLFGPFDHVPTHDEVMEVFGKSSGEAEYVAEMVADGSYGDASPFEAYLLDGVPGVIDFQSHPGAPCPR